MRMHHGIVEGEPGIFPDPIARFMRGVGRFFDRGRRQDQAPPTDTDGPTGSPDSTGPKGGEGTKDAPDTPT